MGQQAAQRASQVASANAQRAVPMADAQRRSFLLAGRRSAPQPRRRRSLPIRLIGLLFRLAFVVVWVAVAASIVAFALQQSKGR